MSPKLRSLTMIGLVLCGTSAIAAPPTFTGKPIIANLGTNSVVVNLRAQGVVSGTAPLVVKPGEVRVNKQPSRVVAVEQVSAGGGGGVVCLQLRGSDLKPA